MPDDFFSPLPSSSLADQYVATQSAPDTSSFDRFFEGQETYSPPMLETPMVMGESTLLDPREQGLLDLVHSAESRSVHGSESYNVIFGYNEDRMARPITEMTVRELLTEMPGMVSRFGGSASGRYQFIQSTLQEMVDDGHVSPDALFNQATQDQLAITRMRSTRNLDAFLNGDISSRDFALELAREWAGLPDPRTGRSYYHGHAGNQATIGLDTYIAGLERIQQMPMAQPQSNGRYDAMELASSFMGMNENVDHQALGEFMSRAIGRELDPRETLWCAAFVNAILADQGLPITEHPLWSLSFLEYGEPTDSPQQGDIVVLNRGPAGADYGHVGFFAGFDGNGNIRVLGGNQSDGVNIQSYSQDALAGYRDVSQMSPDDMHQAVTESIESSPSPLARAQATQAMESYSQRLFDQSLRTIQR